MVPLIVGKTPNLGPRELEGGLGVFQGVRQCCLSRIEEAARGFWDQTCLVHVSKMQLVA